MDAKWIRGHQNVLIQGATGSGKTHLACALAHQACRQGLTAQYVRVPHLFEEFALCHADGSFRNRLAEIAKNSVVIVDDFAIAPIGPRLRPNRQNLMTHPLSLTKYVARVLTCAELPQA